VIFFVMTVLKLIAVTAKIILLYSSLVSGVSLNFYVDSGLKLDVTS